MSEMLDLQESGHPAAGESRAGLPGGPAGLGDQILALVGANRRFAGPDNMIAFSTRKRLANAKEEY